MTLEYASDNGLGVDKAGFDTEMEKQRERARNARSGAKSIFGVILKYACFDHLVHVAHPSLQRPHYRQKQRERARNARSGAKSMGVQNGLLTDITTPSEYVGYSELNALGTVEDIILDDALVNEAQAAVTAPRFVKSKRK